MLPIGPNIDLLIFKTSIYSLSPSPINCRICSPQSSPLFPCVLPSLASGLPPTPGTAPPAPLPRVEAFFVPSISVACALSLKAWLGRLSGVPGQRSSWQVAEGLPTPEAWVWAWEISLPGHRPRKPPLGQTWQRGRLGSPSACWTACTGHPVRQTVAWFWQEGTNTAVFQDTNMVVSILVLYTCQNFV